MKRSPSGFRNRCSMRSPRPPVTKALALQIGGLDDDRESFDGRPAPGAS
jgi:hypothetical protein